jgi:hypothetical protein
MVIRMTQPMVWLMRRTKSEFPQLENWRLLAEETLTQCTF